MPGWATYHIQRLQNDETVKFRPRGNSMSGKVESGQQVTVVPITDPDKLRVGDVVLCKVSGREYLHLIGAVQKGRFRIENNRGKINGWIGADQIYGKCAQVEP